jgi:tetratricopeptide (TPR) repeat protein
LAQILRERGEPQTARGILEEALSVGAGNNTSRASLRFDLGCLALEQGDLPRSIRHLELARLDGIESQSEMVLGKVLKELARAVGLQGDKTRASALLVQSAKASQKAKGAGLRLDWETHLDLALANIQLGFLEQALAHLHNAIQEAEVAKSITGMLSTTVQFAQLYMMNNEWTDAVVCLERALELAIQIGDRTQQSHLLIELGRVRRFQGEIALSRDLLEQAAVKSQNIGWWEGSKRGESELEMLKYAKQSLIIQ